jgi:hypothetical protein
MGFVEYLRVRHAFTTFASILATVTAFAVFSIIYGLHNAHQTVHHAGSNQDSSYSISVGSGSGSHPSGDDDQEIATPKSLASATFTIPIGLVFGVASYLAMGFATILGSSLNKENGRGGFAFTKPISRQRLALTYLAIDLAGIGATFAFSVLLGLASFAILGILGKVVLEPGAAMIAGVGLGAAVMWYGLLQAATAMRVSGGGLTVGLSWVFFFLGLPFYAITFLGPVFHGLIAVLDFFNPLAYFAVSSRNDVVAVSSILGFSDTASFAITWGLAIAAFAVAMYGWKRVEV